MSWLNLPLNGSGDLKSIYQKIVFFSKIKYFRFFHFSEFERSKIRFHFPSWATSPAQAEIAGIHPFCVSAKFCICQRVREYIRTLRTPIFIFCGPAGKEAVWKGRSRTGRRPGAQTWSSWARLPAEIGRCTLHLKSDKSFGNKSLLIFSKLFVKEAFPKVRRQLKLKFVNVLR